jgi:hypothetical protein
MKIHKTTGNWKRNVCSFVFTLNAFDVRTMCDAEDVQALLPFSPNPLKHVFCDILDGMVDASSQFRKRLRKWGASKHCPWRNPKGRNHTLSGPVTEVAMCRRCLRLMHDKSIDLIGFHWGTRIYPYANVVRHRLVGKWTPPLLRVVALTSFVIFSGTFVPFTLLRKHSSSGNGTEHGAWAHLNGVFHKSLPFVCVSVCVSLLSLPDKGSVSMFTGAKNTRNNRKIAGRMCLCVRLCIAISLLGNNRVKTFPSQQKIVGGVLSLRPLSYRRKVGDKFNEI